MATTFTYKITKLKRKLDSGEVSTVEFDITGTDGDHTHTKSTSIELGKAIHSPTPYALLSEEEVINWVKEQTYHRHCLPPLEEEINSIVQEKKTPTFGEGLPWS